MTDINKSEALYTTRHKSDQMNILYRRDIIIDMMCTRRWGHNELDDPSFTQPEMYKAIDAMQSSPDKYAQDLIVRLNNG